MPPNLVDRTIQVVADVFGLEANSVTMQTSHDNVDNWDSLNMINLMIALEAEFGISIDIDKVSEMLSVELIVEILAEIVT